MKRPFKIVLLFLAAVIFFQGSVCLAFREVQNFPLAKEARTLLFEICDSWIGDSTASLNLVTNIIIKIDIKNEKYCFEIWADHPVKNGIDFGGLSLEEALDFVWKAKEFSPYSGFKYRLFYNKISLADFSWKKNHLGIKGFTE